jgi:hypothetical protein
MAIVLPTYQVLPTQELILEDLTAICAVPILLEAI